MRGETPYIETEILLAIMDEDYDSARALIAELGPGAAKLLRRQLLQAIVEIDRVKESQNDQ